MAIRSFRDSRTKVIFDGYSPKSMPPDVRSRAKRKDREGQHSIRVNDQWRICFAWVEGAAEDVEFIDYH